VGDVPQVFDPADEGRLAVTGTMLPLAVLPEMFVYEVYCRDDRKRLSGPGCEFSWNLMMVRSGGFLRRLDGQEDFYDATSAYVSRPGQEHMAGHPAGPGDVCTGIWLSERLVADCCDGGALLPRGRILTSAGLDLAHRSLVAACRHGTDDFEMTERCYDLLGRLRAVVRPADWRRGSTESAQRSLVAGVAEAMASGHLTASLGELARLACCSPHHLSRVFRRVTGQTLTCYRNELRVRAVLAGLEQGSGSLRTLAAEYGFADQAHLTRVVRRHLGTTPTALRGLLTGR
jgi:AraC-like DNA-binding protein